MPRRIILLAALTCFVFAVGIDFLEGLAKGHPLNILTLIREQYSLSKYTVNHFAKSLEEFLEMLGITLFWVSFILHLQILPKSSFIFLLPSTRQ